MNARRLSALGLVAVFAAACGSSATPSPAPGGSGGPSAAASAGASIAGATATAYPTPSSDTIAIAPTASATAAGASALPGATPAPRAAWVTGQTVKQYVLTSPGTGWVLTNRGLWQTIDDGVSWANAYPHGLIASSIRGLGALDANHALVAAVDVGHSTSTYYVWHTGDAGRTWAYTALPPLPHDIHPTTCSPGDFCGQPGDPPAKFDYVDAATAFVHIGVASGVDGLANYVFETTNGGVTWTARTYTFPDPGAGPNAPYRIQFETPSVGVAEYENLISSTATGWGHWTHRQLTTANWWTPQIFFLASNNWVADEGLDYGTVHYYYAVSHDRGATWVDHEIDAPGIAHLTGTQVQFLSPTVWIGTVQTNGTAGYTDGPSQTIYTVDGSHWALMGPQPFNGSIATFADATHGWTGPNTQALTARLYSTSDGGLHWHLITP
jgi:hypothetical protein